MIYRNCLFCDFPSIKEYVGSQHTNQSPHKKKEHYYYYYSPLYQSDPQKHDQTPPGNPKHSSLGYPVYIRIDMQ